MKVAISVPDPVFKAAERAARRLHVSRSRLYSEAMSEFLLQREGNAITEALNRVYGGRREKLDPFIRRAQANLVDPDESW